MRDTSMEDLAQSTEVLAALEVARARSQDAAESVADGAAEEVVEAAVEAAPEEAEAGNVA